MKIKLLHWIMVILWMALIFFLSDQPAMESSELSSGMTKKVFDIIREIAPDIKTNQGSVEHIIRKSTHFGIFLILGFLVSNAIISYNIPKFKHILLALLVCVLYAICDETHQIFIPGRSGHIRDVLIDSSGGLVGILGMYAIRGIKRKTLNF